MILHCMMVQRGVTALIYAAREGHLDVIKYLVKYCGVDANAEGVVSNYIYISISDLVDINILMMIYIWYYGNDVVLLL